MTVGTLAVLVSVVLASLWAGLATWLIARFTARSIENAENVVNEIVGDEPTIFAPAFRAPSRRVATLRAINSLPSLYDVTTNDIEDSDGIKTMATAQTVAA